MVFFFPASCNSPCLNGGECVEPNRCQCPSDFTGDTCEEHITEAETENLTGQVEYESELRN